MSQFPPPYSPYSFPPVPQTYGGYPSPWPDLLAPARRAAVALFVLAGVILIFAVCAGVLSAIDLSKMPPETQPQIQAMDAKCLKMTGIPLQLTMRHAAVEYVVLGLLLVVAGAITRTGRRGGVIGSIVLVSLALIYFGLGIVGAAQAPSGMVLVAVILAMLVLILRWLIRALRNATLMQNALAQYQVQFQQYQPPAISAGPGAAPPAEIGGYGYGGDGGTVAPPRPPPQSPVNPPTPPTDQNTNG